MNNPTIPPTPSVPPSPPSSQTRIITRPVLPATPVGSVAAAAPVGPAAASAARLRYYQDRARGIAMPSTTPSAGSIVHAQAEAVQVADRLRRLDGEAPGDSGRKA
jgi:hypothetical protein